MILKEELQALNNALVILEEELQAKRDDNTVIIIQGDERTPHGQIVQMDEKLVIVVDQDGNMKLNNDKSVTFTTLKEELQAQRQLLDNTTMIIIQGDDRSSRGHIVQIMDIARQVGLVDQVIATEPQRKLTK